jgi:signal transduction histidine kinase
VNSELAASGTQPSGNAGRRGVRAGRDRRASHRPLPDWELLPEGWRRSAILLLGVVAATGVGYATAVNPAAAPGDAAMPLRVLIILALITAGVYAQTSKIQARMGSLLIAAGVFSSLWLLNGSSNGLLFSVGVVCSGIAPLLFAYLALAHPTGHLLSRVEQRFLRFTGGTMALLWLLGIAMTEQPPLKTPLLQCTPHCPVNAFSLGSATQPVGVVKAAMVVAWLALTIGTPVLLRRRARLAPAPVRRSLTPVTVIAIGSGALLASYVLAEALGLNAAGDLGALYVGCVVALPLAILEGLSRERLFMGQTLAEFVNQLARLPNADPEALMAAALRDPSVRIAYRRRGRESYVDGSGDPLDVPADKAVSWIERSRHPVAAVIYDPDLVDYERFVHAAGAAALIRLEKEQLEADLRASTADLVASRVRLMETAAAERRRLERDLHDGVQQHLVGLRLKLEMATEAMRHDPAHGERMLVSVGRQIDDLLQEVRSLARGIYPSLLSQYGLGEALRAAARSSSVPVQVQGSRIGRYPEDLEVAVYFCCLEALQNVAKHAGDDVSATLTLRERGPELRFEVQDTGVGFDLSRAPAGHGLINMRDRIEAVGGTLAVTSRRGRGTTVRGSVPVP